LARECCTVGFAVFANSLYTHCLGFLIVCYIIILHIATYLILYVVSGTGCSILQTEVGRVPHGLIRLKSDPRYNSEAISYKLKRINCIK